MGHEDQSAAQALEALLQEHGLEAEALMDWARERVAQLLDGGPGEGELSELLEGMPDLKALSATGTANDALLGGDDDGFTGLNTGNFEAVDEEILEEDLDVDAVNEDDSMELTALQTGEFEVVEGGIENDHGDEDVAVPEELEALQSGEYEMVDADELEELDDSDFVEFQSGEYEIVSEDEDAEQDKAVAQPMAPGPSESPPEAEAEPDARAESDEQGEVDDDDDLDIDIDLDF